MGRRKQEYGKRRKLKWSELIFGEDIDIMVELKTVLSIIGLQLVLFLLTVNKGLGLVYLPTAIVLIVLTVVGYGVTLYFKADKFILTVAMLLISIGFLMQQIEAGRTLQIRSFLLKFSVAIVVAAVVAAGYQRYGQMLSYDIVIRLMICAQLVLCGVTLLFGGAVGVSEQRATILLGGITPLELVKVAYIFIAVGLLCKPETKTICIGKTRINREILLIALTAVLGMVCLLCSEFGTFMIIYICGLLLMVIYSQNRKMTIALTVSSVVGFVGLWGICDKILFPMLLEDKIVLPGAVCKIVQRFGSALHPETVMSSYGYQTTTALEALTLGSVWGISSEKFRLDLPEASSDFAFSNVTQTCGIIIAIVVLLCCVILLRRGILQVAEKYEDMYFRGLATGISLLIAVENAIHIAYNIACFPVSGVVFYLVSAGFTAIVSGFALIAVLLVLSIGKAERGMEE